MAHRGLIVSLIGIASTAPACFAFLDTGDLSSGAPTDGDAASTTPGLDARTDDVITDTDGAALDAPSTSDAYAKAVMTDAPVAYFRFRETSGGTCKNEIAGSTITCVYPSTGATLGAPGIAPGDSSVGFADTTDFVTVYGLSGWEGPGGYTVEAWFHYQDAVYRVFSRMDNGGSNMRTGSWAFTDVDAGFVTETWTNGTILFGSHTTLPAPGDFVHLVYTFDPALGRDVVYLNASEGMSYVSNPGTRTAATSPLTVGGFRGWLAELAVYDERLAPDRIAAHYAAR